MGHKSQRGKASKKPAKPKAKKPASRNGKPEQSKGVRFCTAYFSRWKQWMKAADYGYVAWPIGRK